MAVLQISLLAKSHRPAHLNIAALTEYTLHLDKVDVKTAYEAELMHVKGSTERKMNVT